MKVVLFQDSGASMRPLTDVESTYDLYFGELKVVQAISMKLGGVRVSFTVDDKPIGTIDDDVLLVNSMALGDDGWFGNAVNRILRDEWDGEKGMVEGKRLVFARVSKADVKAISPFLSGEIDEQKVGAICQKVMPIRTTHTVYDELMRKNQPRVLLNFPWEFLQAGLKDLVSRGVQGPRLAETVYLEASEVDENSVVLGKTALRRATVKGSIITGPAIVEDSEIINSYVGPHAVVRGAVVRGFIGDYSRIEADVKGGVRVGAGSAVLSPLEKDLPPLSSWGEEEADRDKALARAVKTYRETGGSEEDESRVKLMLENAALKYGRKA